MLGAIVLSIPSVQNRLADRLTTKINRNYDTDIMVEGVSIGFDGAVNLASFFIADHHSDTLFYAKNFKTDLFSIGQWVDGNLFFSNTDFEDIFLKIITYEGEEHNSFFQFTDKLLKHAEPKTDPDVFVRIDALKISNGRFSIEDKNHPKKPIEFNEISLQAREFYVIDDGVELFFEGLAFNAPDYGMIHLSDADLFYDYCTVEVNSFKLSNKNSFIEGGVNVFLPQNNFKAFSETAVFDLKLNAVLEEEFFNAFETFPKNMMPAEVALQAKGTLNDMIFSTLEINQDVFQINGLFHIEEAFSSSPIKGKFDLQSLNIAPSKLTQLLPLKYVESVPKALFDYPPLEVKGQLQLEGGELQSSLQLLMNKASIASENQFIFVGDDGISRLERFESNAEFKDFDLSPLNNRLGEISAQVNLTGNRSSQGDFDFKFDLDAEEVFLNINKYSKYNNLRITANFNDDQFIANLSIEDKVISASSSFAFTQEQSQNKYQFDLDLNQLNLHLFDSQLGGGKAIYSGNLNLFLVGNTFDELQGNLLFKDLKFENKTESDLFNDFILEVSSKDRKRLIRTINSDLMDIRIEGEFQLSKLIPLFNNAFAEVFPFFEKHKLSTEQDLSYYIGVETDHLTAIFPTLTIDKKAEFRGILSTEEHVSKMNLNVPKISYKGINIDNLELQLDNQNPLFNSFLSIGKIYNDSYILSDFNTLGIKREDTILFRTEFFGRNDKKDTYEFNYALRFDKNESFLMLKPSVVDFGDLRWRLNPNDDERHLISFDRLSKEIVLNFISAQSGDALIEAQANYTSSQNFSLSLELDKVPLELLSISSEDFSFEGGLDLSLNVQRSPTDNALKFDGAVNQFIMNDLEMGDLKFFTTGNTALNSYEVKLFLSHLGINTLSVNGNILGFDDSPKLDLDFRFNELDLSFLTPVGGGDINNIRGEVTGNVNLWGLVDAPKHNGQLILNKGGLAVPDIHTDYQIADGTVVNLMDQTFDFQSTTFEDTLFGTQGKLQGEINHFNFSDWGFDLNIESDRMLVLNIPEEEEEVFFGSGFLRGNVHLYGPSKNLTIDVVGSTAEGSSIKIPWADDYGLADTSFIKFFDKKKNTISEKQEDQELDEISGLEMNFELDVTNKAEIKVVIDKESGSFLSGSGAGNILMEIDTNGKFNMWGDFITYEGIYNFKNLGVIDKKFNVKEGGTIVWEGNPLGAQMDLEAVYSVPGGSNPALLLDNPNFNRKIPTEVLIRLQGNLLKPDDPIFEIDFPNTSAVFTSEINYRLSDPQISQLQAISLLSQGIFINEVSVSVEGITNNLYEKASDLFSNLLGDDQGKLQVGVNYLQGDRSGLQEINSEDRLGLTLSTQITDKILLNGEIGVPVGGIEETLIVGDLQIDFILNEEGSLKAKVFNKENEFRYIGDELGYTQGVGLSYQVDFETFSELIKKIVKGSENTPSLQNESSLSDPLDVGINFINKK